MKPSWEKDGPVTWCPECGYGVKVDEDGCCVMCGSQAFGRGVDQAIEYRHRAIAQESCDASPTEQPTLARLIFNRAAEDVVAERQRQVDAEGWTAEHDDQWTHGELALAACCYTWPGRQDRQPYPVLWPWDPAWYKPKDRRRDLVRAAALLLAEIERIDRLEQRLQRAEDSIQGVPS